MAKRRTSIPTAVAAGILFAADRTCCVCRESGKPIQIHHIDEDPSNHDPANLAVLCLTCHEETQRRGGFARRLDADQIRLYRDSWNQVVAARRSSGPDDPIHEPPVGGYDAELVTSLVEIDREAENWVNLSFLYDAIGNEELRDKAVEQAIHQGASDAIVIMLRRMQGRLGEVAPDVISRELGRLEQSDRYRSRASVHEDLGEYRQAAEDYIRGLHSNLDKLSDFTLAHHLKELVATEVIPGLFVKALQDAADADDLWWQVRALEELEWTTELHALVLENEDRIDTDPDLDAHDRAHLLMLVADAKGDAGAYREARKALERLDAEIPWGE